MDEKGEDIGHHSWISTDVELITHPTVTMWNNMFTVLCTVFHIVVVAIVNSPTSVHFVLLIIFLSYVSLDKILQPRVQYPQDNPGAFLSHTLHTDSG